MKLVTAIIRPSKLDEVVDALSALGVDKVTVTETRGFGGHAPRADARATPSAEIEFAVQSERLQEVLQTLRAAAETGKPGDGMIAVTDLSRAIRIRNGATGDEAL